MQVGCGNRGDNTRFAELMERLATRVLQTLENLVVERSTRYEKCMKESSWYRRYNDGQCKLIPKKVDYSRESSGR